MPKQDERGTKRAETLRATTSESPSFAARDFPHLVELTLQLELSKFDEMQDFHRERGIQSRQDTGLRDDRQLYVYFCFADPMHADAFRDRFGGERLMVEDHCDMEPPGEVGFWPLFDAVHWFASKGYQLDHKTAASRWDEAGCELIKIISDNKLEVFGFKLGGEGLIEIVPYEAFVGARVNFRNGEPYLSLIGPANDDSPGGGRFQDSLCGKTKNYHLWDGLRVRQSHVKQRWSFGLIFDEPYAGRRPLTESRAKEFAAKFFDQERQQGREPTSMALERAAKVEGYYGGREFLRDEFLTFETKRRQGKSIRGRPPKQIAKK